MSNNTTQAVLLRGDARKGVTQQAAASAAV